LVRWCVGALVRWCVGGGLRPPTCHAVGLAKAEATWAKSGRARRSYLSVVGPFYKKTGARRSSPSWNEEVFQWKVGKLRSLREQDGE
jgi:hypothetical protein